MDRATPQELGWKALAVNLSDVAAMGGVPGYALVSLALPPPTRVDWVTRLYEGMLEIAKEYGVGIVGGDVHRAPQVVITLALWGNVYASAPLTRSAARPGDRIAVTGTLGASAGGLKLFLEGKPVPPALREAHLRPRPQIESGQHLLRSGVKAAIDISDGLLADLGHVCRASGVGARVIADRVPVDPHLREAFGGDALGLALSGGEDYQLLFTAPPGVLAKVKEHLSATDIGEITSQRGQIDLLDVRGQPVPWQKGGWQHFGAR